MMYKMYRLLWIIGLFVGFTSCEKTYQSSIPDARVYMELPLKQSPYLLIDESAYFLEIKEVTKYGEALGYAGLIVGYTIENGFCVYDRCCPIEARRDVVVHLQREGSWKAVCSKCGSEFDLNNHGVLIKGDQGAYLKPYKAIKMSDNVLKIYN